ncbi:MAG TPA: outer membrane lipoprotein carrier protein LolA [Bacteroidia bacterium]|nr:outer membrane lipoprotein carrier protein LolA [Bacteroidia bacterium]HRS59796.1 outer membrane lipoprotein carrier protein LolA [Bacteroidia bacterium]HRU68514.1 outer membrane lipoprotein carrier protein LolA [Bacteroidia bacterium]
MRHFLAIVFLFNIISSFTLTAQDEVARANEIIRKTVAKYKAYTSSEVSFNYTMENRADKYKEQQKGMIYLKNGNFNLTIGTQTIISNQVKVWTYMKDVNEVQISKYDPDELEINPTEIFTMWETGFLSRYAGDVTVNNLPAFLIEMTPVNKNLSYYKVKLFIDKKNYSILRIQTFYKESALILTFDIVSVKPNVPINDNMFRFDVSKYPGIEVVDLTK